VRGQHGPSHSGGGGGGLQGPKEPELADGPSGFQTFKGNRNSKTIEFTNKQVKGKNRGSHSGSGGAAGNGADLKVAGQDLKANYVGKTGVTGTRNGETVDAKDTGTNNYVAKGKGRDARADVQGTELKSAKAGGKEVTGNYNKGAKTADAVSGQTSERWHADLKNDLGTATESKKGGKATLKGIKTNSERVYGKHAGKQVVAGRSPKTAKTKYSYGRVPTRGGRKVQYISQQAQKNRALHTRIIQGKRKTLYQSSVNKQNEVGLHDTKSGKKLASIKPLGYTDVPCQNLKNNMWKKGRDDFYQKKSLKIDYKKNAKGEYEFPSCMDIEAKIKLPQGVKVKDLVGALTVVIPGCGEFVCSKQTECMSHQCFYKNLCPDSNAKPSLKHKGFAKYLLSQTDSNVCEASYPGGLSTMKFKYCPDPNASMAKLKRCRATLFSTIAVSAMQVQIDVWQVKKRPMGCDAKKKADRDNLKKIGCKRVLIDYDFKWQGLPVGTFGKAVGQALDKTNCNLGQRPCIGHDKGNIFGNLFGRK
jgi:predicted DNA-binding WGR domain protein